MRYYDLYEKYKWQFWFVVGIAAVIIYLLPYYVLQENAYFQIHDELDDGIFKYMLYAKNLGVNGSFVPEFMGGQSRSSIVVSSLWGVLLYKFFSPYTAYLLMMTVSILSGYVGIFLLGGEISGNAFASFFAAVVFSYLPFKSMFALNIVGFPLFIYSILLLLKNSGKKNVVAYAILVFYSTGITLAWAGYMSVGLLAIVILTSIIVSKRKQKAIVANIVNVIIAFGILSAIQILGSIDLIKDTFFSSEVSHREEMIPVMRDDYFKHFIQLMHFGGSHSECCSYVISIAGIVLIIILPFIYVSLKKKNNGLIKKETIKKYWLLCGLYASNVLLAIFSCVWTSEPVVSLRTSIGGVLKTFQFDRIYWMMPSVWMCVLILEIAILVDAAKLIVDNTCRARKLLAVIPAAIILIVTLLYAKNVYLSSAIYHNLRLMIFPDTYHMDSWRDYFAEELFVDIDKAISKNKDEYRVVSVAINPAVALYNGFYTVDGYSTDYPLAYKHQFRKIMVDELDKDESIKDYFDNWGNRCYLFSTEIPLSTGLNNAKDSIDELSIDTSVLKELGADYIFSNAQILNSDELNIIPLGDSPFEKYPFKYKIWVYEIR